MSLLLVDYSSSSSTDTDTETDADAGAGDEKEANIEIENCTNANDEREEEPVPISLSAQNIENPNGKDVAEAPAPTPDGNEAKDNETDDAKRSAPAVDQDMVDAMQMQETSPSPASAQPSKALDVLNDAAKPDHNVRKRKFSEDCSSPCASLLLVNNGDAEALINVAAEVIVVKETTQSAQSPILPKAITLLGASKPFETPIDETDDPSKHSGRQRSFKHERGNWATYICVPGAKSIRDACLLEDAQELCQLALENVVDLQIVSDPHISLSKTVVLQYHLIDAFIESLEKAFATCTSFSVCLHNLKIYSNEQKTRTFIAFKVDDVHCQKLLALLNVVDVVMHDFRLAQFYEDPSFHISFLWCLGDQVELINAHLDKIKMAFDSLFESGAFSVDIAEIRCKSGHKEFTFKLKD